LGLQSPTSSGWSSTSQPQRSATLKGPPKRLTVTFEQLTYSNMLTLNALVELLTEKGVLSKPEILERIKKLQSETKGAHEQGT
jgi:hypothetical protein